jgi:hypothetical protein
MPLGWSNRVAGDQSARQFVLVDAAALWACLVGREDLTPKPSSLSLYISL